MSLHLVRQNLLLRLVTVLEQLLNNVIAENISHQLQAVGLDLAENLLLLIAVGRLELLLDEARPVLVAAKFHNMTIYILKQVNNTIRKMDQARLP